MSSFGSKIFGYGKYDKLIKFSQDIPTSNILDTKTKTDIFNFICEYPDRLELIQNIFNYYGLSLLIDFNNYYNNDDIIDGYDYLDLDKDIIQFILMSDHKNINIQDWNGNRVLHYVCKYDVGVSVNMIKHLIKCGADPYYINNNNEDVLHYLLMFKHNNIKLDMVKLFIEDYGFDINKLCPDGNNYLHYILIHKDYIHWDVIKYFINNGLSINSLDSNNNNVFMLIAENDKINLNLIRYFIRKKININQINNYGENVLFKLCKSRNINLSMIKCLFKNKVNVKLLNNKDESVLFYLYQNEYATVELVDYLVRRGAKINCINSDNETVLFKMHKSPCIHGNSSMNNNLDMVKYAIDKKVKVNHTNYNDENVLFTTTWAYMSLTGSTCCGETHRLDSSVHMNFDNMEEVHKLIEIIKYYISIGINVNQINFCDYNVLFYACGCNNPYEKNIYLIELFKIYIDNGININHIYSSKNILMFSFYNCKFDINLIKYLVDNGVNINHKDKNGVNVLNYMILNDTMRLDVIKYIVENGADVNYAGSDWKVSESSEYQDIIKYINNKKSNPVIFM